MSEPVPSNEGVVAPLHAPAAAASYEVGSLAWAAAGGPPLSFAQGLRHRLGTASVLAQELWPRLRLMLADLGVLSHRWPREVDLSAWAPPETQASTEAQELMWKASSEEMAFHSLRTYYFSAIMVELSSEKPAVDHEALFVAAATHDVGLFDRSPPPGCRCFSVASAHAARRIMTAAGWDAARQDRVAMAVTSNLNPRVAADRFGPEAHFLRMGGGVEVMAQEWMVHPENLRWLLARYPRDRLPDSLVQIHAEEKRNPGCRFEVMEPFFSLVIRHGRFSMQTRRPRAP